MKKEERITILITPELKKKVTKKAIDDNTNLSVILRMFLQSYAEGKTTLKTILHIDE